MAFVLGRGFVDMDLDDGKFNAGLQRASTKMKSFQAGLQSFANKAKVLLAGISAVGFFSAREGIAREDAIANLEASMESMGGSIGMTAKQVMQFGSELQRTTGRGKTELYNMLAQMRTFGNIGEKSFKRTAVAVTDLAAKMNTDMKSAMMQLSKALEDPTRGLAALAESGISFSKAEQDVIKDLHAANRLWEAQSKILDKVEQQVGGTAAKKNQGLSKSVNDMGEAFADLKSVTAEILTPAIKDLSDLVGKLNERFKGMSQANKEIVGEFIKWGSLAAFAVVVINGIGGAVGFVVKVFTALSGAIKGVWAVALVPLLAKLLKVIDSVKILNALIAAHMIADLGIDRALEFLYAISQTATKLGMALQIAAAAVKVLAVAIAGLLVGAFIRSTVKGEKFRDVLAQVTDGMRELAKIVFSFKGIAGIINLAIAGMLKLFEGLSWAIEEVAKALGMDSLSKFARARTEKLRQMSKEYEDLADKQMGFSDAESQAAVLAMKKTFEQHKINAALDREKASRQKLLDLMKDEASERNRELTWAERKEKIDERAKMLMEASTQAARDFRRAEEEGTRRYLQWRGNLLKTQRGEEESSLDKAFSRMREIVEARRKDDEEFNKVRDIGPNSIVSMSEAFNRLSTASPDMKAFNQRKKTNEELVLIRHGQENLIEEFKKTRNFGSVYAQ